MAPGGRGDEPQVRATVRPVAWAMALARAGASGGTPGSPTPVGGCVDGAICTSTAGISARRSTG
ncbi:Uncharacterised protein [Bordetella pertussis]|nr:Uncharacterised protein [Bordetella pertussis]